MTTEPTITKNQLSIKNNLWVIWSFIGAACISMLYVGIKSKNYKWIGLGFAHFICISIITSGLEKNDSSVTWNTLMLLLFAGSIFYVMKIRKDYQLYKYNLLQAHLKEYQSNLTDEHFETSLQLWKKLFPDHYNDVDFRYHSFNGIVAVSIAKIDGVFTKNEATHIEKNIVPFLNYNETQTDNFAMGIDCAAQKQLQPDMIRLLQVSLNNEKKNISTIKMLVSISASDGYIDKIEYDFIKLISFCFGKNLPAFEDLASEAGVKTSDIQKDEEIKKAKQVRANMAKNTAKGAGLVAGAAVLAFIGSSGGSAKTKAPGSKSSAMTSPKSFSKTAPKCCAICQFWTGPRKIKSNYRSSLEIAANQLNNGECGHPRKVFNSRSATTSGCTKYQLWGSFNH